MALLINGIKVAGLGGSGRDGKDGENGAGIPTGGAIGQVLVKNSENDYDTKWENLVSIDNTLSIEGGAADAKAVGDALVEINTTLADKQTKNLVVTVSGNNLASHTPAEILSYQTSGAKAVFYTGGVEAAFLEGNSSVSVFYTSFINASRIQYTIYQINSDKSIQTVRGEYTPPVNTNVATKDYVATEIANLINSAPEALDTLGEIAAAFQDNKEIVDVLTEAIGIKPDWNQNDESAIDYIKNRTHYKTGSQQTIYSYDGTGTALNLYITDWLTNKPAPNLEEGEYYTVIFNGIEYNNIPCVLAEEELDNSECYYNLNLDGIFEFSYESSGNVINFRHFDWTTADPSATFVILKDELEYHPLDERYLPYQTETWTFTLADGTTVTKEIVLK